MDKNKRFDVIIEVQKGSGLKYEIDEDTPFVLVVSVKDNSKNLFRYLTNLMLQDQIKKQFFC